MKAIIEQGIVHASALGVYIFDGEIAALATYQKDGDAVKANNDKGGNPDVLELRREIERLSEEVAGLRRGMRRQKFAFAALMKREANQPAPAPFQPPRLGGPRSPTVRWR